jgi:hypothetical protein
MRVLEPSIVHSRYNSRYLSFRDLFFLLESSELETRDHGVLIL